MMEWISDNAWLTVFFCYIAYAIFDRTLDAYHSRLEAKLSKLDDEIATQKVIDILTARVKLAEQEAKRYKLLWETTRQTKERASDNTRQTNGFDYEDLMRARRAMEDRQRNNFSRRKTPSEEWLEIKTAYRNKLKLHHPDKVRARGGSEAEIAGATKKTQQLNADYAKAKARYYA